MNSFYELTMRRWKEGEKEVKLPFCPYFEEAGVPKTFKDPVKNLALIHFYVFLLQIFDTTRWRVLISTFKIQTFHILCCYSLHVQCVKAYFYLPTHSLVKAN